MVTLPPFPEGGVVNKLPLALLLVESLLVSDVGVRCLGSLRFFFIFLGEITGSSDVIQEVWDKFRCFKTQLITIFFF
jgi:hypothetical protein